MSSSCEREPKIRQLVARNHMLAPGQAQVLLDEIDRLRDVIVEADDENRIIEYLRFSDVDGAVIQAIEEGVHLNDEATWGDQ